MTGLAAILLGAIVAGSLPAVMFGISRWSGWADAAKSYPAQPVASDADKGFGSLRGRAGCGYNNCIHWRTDDDYLHLRIMTPFNIFHPPLSIPWTEVELTPGKWSAAIVFGRYRWHVPMAAVRRELRNRELLAGGVPS